VCVVEANHATIYELLAIIPFIREHGTDPKTGKRLAPSDLIRLNFFENSEGERCDPVSFKVFNEHTHLVAIRPSGNVYTKESIERLNIKPQHWHDLMTDEPFKRSDIITSVCPGLVGPRASGGWLTQCSVNAGSKIRSMLRAGT